MKKPPRVNPTLAKVLARASARPMTAEQRSRQLVSLAFGNLKLENDCATRAMIEEAVRVVATR